MAALPPKRRDFVVNLYDEEAPAKGDGLLIFAAAKAGYGTGQSSNKVLSVIANRLIQDDRVKEAIAEYSRGLVRAISPEAVCAVRALVRDPTHKDHARAVMAIMDRFDPLETTHTVKIEDNRPPSAEVTQAVLDRIEQLMLRVGLVKPAPVIDGSCTVIDGTRQ
jgi:hypothetical protein